jgi:hypothetical protein
VKIGIPNKLLAAASICLLFISSLFLVLEVKQKRNKRGFFPSIVDKRISEFQNWNVRVNHTYKRCVIASKEKSRITNQGSDIAVNYRKGVFGGLLGEVNEWNWRFMFNNDTPILEGHKVIVQLNHEGREGKQFELENYKSTAAITPTDKMGFEIFRNIKSESSITVTIKNSFGATDIMDISGEGFWAASEHCYNELENEIYKN